MSAWVELEARVWRSGSARGGHLLWAECNGVVGWAARRGGPSGGGGDWPKKRFSVFYFYFVLNFFLNFQFRNLTLNLNFLP
jgi:hypothetical protein